MSVVPLEEKNKIIEYYKSSPMSLHTLKQVFPYCQPTLSKILKEANVSIWPKSLIFNPQFNENYFQTIDSEYKAYFLGLLITDGCVFIPSDGHQASISITLKANDGYLLRRFKDEIGCSTQLIYDRRNLVTIAFRSNKIAEDLKNNGVPPGKNERSHLPSLPQNMYPHFLRGAFDGDGSIMSKMSPSGKHKHCIAYCGTPDFMVEIQEHFINTLGISYRKPYSYNNYFGEIKWSRIEDLKKIGDYLYDEATIYMTRKHDLYLDFLNHYNLQ